MKKSKIFLMIATLAAVMVALSYMQIGYGRTYHSSVPEIKVKTQSASAPQVTQTKVPPKTAAALRAEPKIVAFSVEPRGMLIASYGPTKQIAFAWKVEQGSLPSPIRNVQIFKADGPGPALNLKSGEPSGTQSINLPLPIPAGRIVYTLTATNEQGNSQSASATFEILTPSQFGEKLDLRGVTMDKSAEDAAFDVRGEITNRNIFNIGVTLRVYAGREGLSGSSPAGDPTVPVQVGFGGLYAPFVVSARLAHVEGSPWNKLYIRALPAYVSGLPPTLRTWEYNLSSEIKRVYFIQK
jgi:hypothetical protein